VSLRRPWQAVGRDRSHVVLLLAILVVVASRLPFLRLPLSRDEAGFLVLGHDWLTSAGHAASSLPAGSLYGDYWVDRPPLLLLLFRLGDLLGGDVGLRLLGTASAVIAVVFAALAARRVGGPRAYAAAAVAAALLLATPLNGTAVVNGELVAGPFVAVGLWAWIRPSRPVHAGLVAGAAAAAAVLVKQSFIDVFVFVAVAELLRGLAMTRARLLAWGGFVLGAALLAGAVLGFAMAHGTSLSALYDAMLTFRVEARSVAGLQPHTAERVRLMSMATIVGGLVPLLAYAAWRLRAIRLSPDRAVVLALVAVVAYDAVAIVFGGGYWPHYLVQPIVPVAILAGIGVAAVPAGARWPRVSIGIAVLLAIIAVGANVARIQKPVDAAGAGAGAVIGAAAEPGDTIATLYGDPTIVRESGLTSPYPYLWTLPIRVRDPKLATVDKLLSGPDAPSWIVVTKRVAVWDLHVSHLEQVFAERYVLVRKACGMRIYLRADVARTVDDGPASCRIDLRESWS
jgi:hypothetical protein